MHITANKSKITFNDLKRYGKKIGKLVFKIYIKNCQWYYVSKEMNVFEN